MKTKRDSYSILALTILVSWLSLPTSSSAEVCRFRIDAPSLVILETPGTMNLLPTRDAEPITLEASPSHRVLAVTEPGVLMLDASAGCELTVNVTRAEIRREALVVGPFAADITAFFAEDMPTKEEDHDFDPDPGFAGPHPMVTLIDLAGSVKEEDHDFDPDPGFAWIPAKEEDHDFDPDPGLAWIPGKEEDHDFDPDPGLAGDWPERWDAVSAVVRRLGPGWYFVIENGTPTREILIERGLRH